MTIFFTFIPLGILVLQLHLATKHTEQPSSHYCLLPEITPKFSKCKIPRLSRPLINNEGVIIQILLGCSTFIREIEDRFSGLSWHLILLQNKYVIIYLKFRERRKPKSSWSLVHLLHGKIINGQRTTSIEI
jgi:hypothetical protein